MKIAGFLTFIVPSLSWKTQAEDGLSRMMCPEPLFAGKSGVNDDTIGVFTL